MTSPIAPLLVVLQDPRPATLVASIFTTYCVFTGEGGSDVRFPHPALATSAIPHPAAIPANVRSLITLSLRQAARPGACATRYREAERSVCSQLFRQVVLSTTLRHSISEITPARDGKFSPSCVSRIPIRFRRDQ